MTIDLSNNTPRVNYTVASGNTQSVFTVPFAFFDADDVVIYVNDTLKVEGSDYTVAGGDGDSGSVTFDPEVSGEAVVVIYRRVPIRRTSDFNSSSEISRVALNDQLDALTAMVADLKDRVDRAVHIPDGDYISGTMQLPDISTRAGKYFAFGVDGTPSMTDGVDSDIVVSAFFETLADDDSVTEFLGTLGITATASEINTVAGYSFSDIAFYGEATASQYKAATADKVLTADQVWAAGAVVTLTDGATITPDFATGFNFEVTLGGNRVLGNPTNMKVGQSGFIKINQDATGGRTLTLDTNFITQGGAQIALSSGANDMDILFYCVTGASEIVLNVLYGVA
jgi:hypothetical protein